MTKVECCCPCVEWWQWVGGCRCVIKGSQHVSKAESVDVVASPHAVVVFVVAVVEMSVVVELIMVILVVDVIVVVVEVNRHVMERIDTILTVRLQIEELLAESTSECFPPPKWSLARAHRTECWRLS